MTVNVGITEAQWQRRVTDLATVCGWLWYHTHDSRRSHAGFPDLVLVRDERLLFVELKTDTGRVSPPQRQWLNALSATPAMTYVWRPGDWVLVRGVLR